MKQQQRQKKRLRRKTKRRMTKNKKPLQKLQILQLHCKLMEKATKTSGFTLTNGLSALEMSVTTTEVSPL